MNRINIFPPELEYEVLVDNPVGVPVGENLWGFTLLHAGQSYATPNMLPNVPFRWSRMFARHNLVERSLGTYDWTCNSQAGQNILARAEVFAERELQWSMVMNPATVMDPTRQGYFDWVSSALDTLHKYGLRAIEPSNEPESGSWDGTLGHRPIGSYEIRQAARDLAPWALTCRDAVDKFNIGRPVVDRVEVWGPSSQSMANAFPDSGLAYNFSATSAAANSRFRGAGFLNGHDGEGGIGAMHLHRFSFHGYPENKTDWSVLPFHFEKARAWVRDCGYGDMPIVVTEHGVYFSPRAPNWLDLRPEQRLNWIMTAFGVSAAYNARMIWYAYDEEHMGLYQLPLSERIDIETAYNNLRSALIGKHVFKLLRRVSDGQLVLTLDANSRILVPLT